MILFLLLLCVGVTCGVHVPHQTPTILRIPVASVSPNSTYEVPYWLGAFISTTNVSSSWTLPLTYKNGGKTPHGAILVVENIGTENISLLASPPETINGASSYLVLPGYTVSVLSSDDWVIISGAVSSNNDMCYLAVGMEPITTLCGDITAKRIALGSNAAHSGVFRGEAVDGTVTLGPDTTDTAFAFIATITPAPITYRAMRFTMDTSGSENYTVSPIAGIIIATHNGSGSINANLYSFWGDVRVGAAFQSPSIISKAIGARFAGVSAVSGTTPTGIILESVNIWVTPPVLGSGPIVVHNHYGIDFLPQSTPITNISAHIRMGLIQGAGLINAGIWANTNTAFNFLCAGTACDVSLRRAAAGAWALGTDQDLRIPGYLSLGSTLAPSNTANGAFSTSRVTPTLQAFGAVVANAASGVLAFTVNTAAGTCESATVTNTNIVSASQVQLTIQGYSGTLMTDGLPTVSRLNTAGSSSGSFVLSLCNMHSANALSGNLYVGFWVLN